MFEFEGSRGEFLKLLAEFGEEPAFVARARAPQVALQALIQKCEAKREELLEWPKFQITVLAQMIDRDWPRLAPMLADTESVSLLESLHAELHTNQTVATNWLTTVKSSLRHFLDSGERFNRNWRTFVDSLDLEPVNKPRRDFNQFYVLEKACAFGSEKVTDGFEPLAMIDSPYLHERFPLLALPSLCGR